LSLEIEADTARIVDFVLSCRVMGRKVEQAMVAFAAQYCSNSGLREMRADYILTAKNKPCLNFWMSSGFSCKQKENRFTWPLDQVYAFPPGIEIHLSHSLKSDSVYSNKQVALDPKGASALPLLTN
jgi:hypothetical protein